MQRVICLSISGLVALLAVAGCAQKAEQKTVEQPAAEADFRLTASFKDLMVSEIDPAADYLWEAVSAEINKNGIEEKQPRTDAEWLAAKHQAVILLEATNLLLMAGRQIVNPGDKLQDADLPGINSPEQIRHEIDGDRASFVKLVHALHDAGMTALKAIENKDAMALSDAGGGIDTACENCHLKYWYPNSGQATQAAHTAPVSASSHSLVRARSKAGVLSPHSPA